MRLLFTALACLFSVSVVGQEWIQFYGGASYDNGRSLKQTVDGGFIITGWTMRIGDNGNRDMILIKTDSNGNEQWSQTFGGNTWDTGGSVQQTNDGGYIISGTIVIGELGAGNIDGILIKTDGNGSEQWSQTFGGGGGSVEQTSDGGFIIGGSHLIKTDENGNEQWSQTFGGLAQQTSDGGFIICSSSQLIKTDGNGNEQWSQTYGNQYPNGNSFDQTSDGGYIITGSTELEEGNRDVYLIKTDSNGNEQWSQTFGGNTWDTGSSVQQTFDGGYIVAGSTNVEDGGENFDVYLIKTDSNGNEQWSQTFGGTGNDFGSSVLQISNGEYVVTGWVDCWGLNDPTCNGFEDVFLIKTDSEGTLSSSFTIPTQSSRKLDKVVDALGRDVNHTSNQILFHIYDDGSVEKKFIVD